ncbi:MAG: pilus assembly protein CpaD [Oceanicaulis sp.]|nr:pilus assembly protein CpaD [Oceanicaulis sp.]
MTAFRTSFAALASLAALTACASTPSADVGLPRATAVAETFRSEMMIDPRDNGLTWQQRSQLAAIASEYKARGHGPLVISYPQGGSSQDAAIGAIAEARTFLYEQGIDWRQIAGGAYEARGGMDGQVIFSFRRYAAVAPECGTSWDNLAVERDNQGHSNFGCAMAANLAAMIADPRDLVAPRTMGVPDTGRRQTVLDAYRAGESTASERSDHESGAVSEVSEN